MKKFGLTESEIDYLKNEANDELVINFLRREITKHKHPGQMLPNIKIDKKNKKAFIIEESQHFYSGSRRMLCVYKPYLYDYAIDEIVANIKPIDCIYGAYPGPFKSLDLEYCEAQGKFSLAVSTYCQDSFNAPTYDKTIEKNYY